jgi:hypothetical protein
MAIIEEVRRARRCSFMMGKKNGMAGRFVERRLKSERLELILEPPACPPYLILVSGIGRYRRDTQKFEIASDSILEVAFGILKNRVKSGHCLLLTLSRPNFAKHSEKCVS